jgi:hypothetical protein
MHIHYHDDTRKKLLSHFRIAESNVIQTDLSDDGSSSPLVVRLAIKSMIGFDTCSKEAHMPRKMAQAHSAVIVP